jgi:hypothetical protein
VRRGVAELTVRHRDDGLAGRVAPGGLPDPFGNSDCAPISAVE